MIKFLSTAICLFLIIAAPVALHSSKIFPYDYKIEVLENGLKIVSILLPNPYIICYYTIVRSGSRNEIEPGKSGKSGTGVQKMEAEPSGFMRLENRIAHSERGIVSRIRSTLNQGWNKLHIKVLQGGGGWGYDMRFVDPEGQIRWSTEGR